MRDWMSEAENATKSVSSSHRSRLVKTLVITSHRSINTSVLQHYKGEPHLSVQKWGVDGLLFCPNATSLLHILQSVSCFPSCSTLCIADAGLPLPADPQAMIALCHIISSSPNLAHLYLFLPSSWNSPSLREALLPRCTSSLQSLSIEASLCSEAHDLIPILTSSSCSLKSLSICFDYTGNRESLAFILSICVALAHNTIFTLHSFSLISSYQMHMDTLDKRICEVLCTMLVHNTFLTSFTLFNARLTETAFRHLFDSLKVNSHLTFVSLAHCTVWGLQRNWPVAAILDCLQVNTNLCNVDLTRTPLENDNAIMAQLLRNQHERVNVLRSRLVRPTTVRLFLCGLPYSGKTTLSRSLANWNRNSSWLSRIKSTTRPKRTRGIEVTILEDEVDDQYQRILLWDLAGQIEFHSFHDSMFPDLSSRATPSMFLFVWNPFETDTKKTRKNVQKFRDELKYWLRFIASKTVKSEMFKPKVLVAITRADLEPEDMRAWLMSDFTALQEEFQDVLQLDEEGFFLLNARDHLQAGELGSHAFHCAQAILKQVPDVYQACAEARELLGNMVHDKQIPPLVTKEKFHQLCEEELQMGSQEMREAVAQSLNDSGDIIYFESLELVVLDTQWFCHEIMGDLLDDMMTKEAFDRSKTADGFFPISALEALLERIVNSRVASGTSKLINRRAHKAFESMKVTGCDLVKLLVGLRLACLEDVSQSNSRIFLPISLSGTGKRTIFPSNWLTSDRNCSTTYLGRRFTCKNFKCTLLTPGLFPLLQVSFHKILHHREVPVAVQLEEDVMAFAFDGVKVLMEFCRLEGKDHFIDILACSSKSLDETIEWLLEHVILNVEKVCAEPRGIRGVDLAHAIIQGASIEKFLDASRRPAVSVEELQDALNNHVERKGVKLTKAGIKSVMYTWQAIPFLATSVVDLLGEVETTKVVQTYFYRLSDTKREISNLLVADQAQSSDSQKPRFSMMQSLRNSFNTRSEFEKNVMRDLEKLGHAVQELSNAVLPRLSELFTFVQEGEAGKLPRMFVVIDDDGSVRRLVSAIVPGLHNLRLQLLCECRSESCHFADGKHGLSLAALDDGLLKRGMPYINALLKVLCMAARVGAHVAVGFGDIIPDFTRLVANIVDAPISDGVPAFTNFTEDWNSPSRIDFKEGQQWLSDVLSSHDCIKGDQIHATFGLRRVRFADSRAGWLCDRHYQEGTPWPA